MLPLETGVNVSCHTSIIVGKGENTALKDCFAVFLTNSCNLEKASGYFVS